MKGLTISFLAENFKRFNAELFDNELPTPKFFLNHTKSALGRFSPSELSITVSTYCEREEEAYQNTLIHEMVHLWQWVRFRSCDHKRTFKIKSADIYTRSNGKWVISRTDVWGDGQVESQHIKICHILIARDGNRYIVGKVMDERAYYFGEWLRKSYYPQLAHFIAKGNALSKLPTSRTRFNYNYFSLEEFEQKIRPTLIEQKKVTLKDDDSLPLVQI